MKHLLFATLTLTLLCFASCRGTKELTDTKHNIATTEAEAYKQKVVAQNQSPECVTARLKFETISTGKQLSAGGHLRMKRDEVIQLSLQVLGFEVAKLEFTPTEVLVVNRMEKEYVRATYADVAFLQRAGLDFYALQALFRGELFVPGERQASAALHRFAVLQHTDNCLLQLTDAPTLNYSFLTDRSSARIRQLSVAGKSPTSQAQFLWSYDDFGSLNDATIPTVMKCAISAEGKTAGFSLQLSRIDNNSDWETHTQVSKKYKERTAAELLGKLLAL